MNTKTFVLILSLIVTVHLASLKKGKKVQIKQDNGVPKGCIKIYKDCLNLNPNDDSNQNAQLCGDTEDLMVAPFMFGISAIKVGPFTNARFYTQPYYEDDHYEDFTADVKCLADVFNGIRNDKYASVKITTWEDPDAWW